jgi:RNA polymerase sigma factor (TIGR02999 family)
MTELLIAWRNGDQTALDRLTPLVYAELHRLASHYMRGQRAGHSFQTSDLLNETYLRLGDHKNMDWQNRAHFYAVAAQAMRRILVDHARTRDAFKRGGGRKRVSLDKAFSVPVGVEDELVALDDALTALAEIDPRKSQIVELRFFGGLTVEETAEVLKISPITVLREWKKAKARLYRELSAGKGDEET